jgi:transposase
VVTAGQRQERPFFVPLMEAGAVRRGKGRVKVRPRCVVGDEGYTSGTIRTWLRRRGIKAVIPQLASERRRRRFDKEIYRERNVVERLMNRLKRWRRGATRYEKRAAHYEAMVTLAAIMEYLP